MSVESAQLRIQPRGLGAGTASFGGLGGGWTAFPLTHSCTGHSKQDLKESPSLVNSCLKFIIRQMLLQYFT